MRGVVIRATGNVGTSVLESLDARGEVQSVSPGLLELDGF
jgi:hypothetical protein